MNPVLFWIFASLMLVFGAMVVLLRNPVGSALSLVVSFLCLAALFVGLDAFFIGIIQVLVYAGAVMVLFLFIIMLLDLKTEQRRKLNLPAFLGGLAVVAAFVALLVRLLSGFEPGTVAASVLGQRVDDVRGVGFALFNDFNLPLQVVGALVLVATVGVVVLSKHRLK